MSDKKLFTIKTSINKKDYSRFLYIATFLRKKFTIPAIIVITALMAGFVSYNNRIFELKSFLIYWLILLIITLFAIVVKIEFQSREREKADKAGVLKSIETLEFFDDILVIKSKIKYYKFYEVIETKNYFIIYFNRRQASIIRKIDLEDSLVDELRNLLTGKIGSKYKKLFK
ncbi:YcxB family protein [Clostridium perfringens]|uniref:YcxB family protein n=1 Tax=Clostridium perfringens TaxID=1502 RepID=UPI0021AC4E34|nr:YcxB family protein [Clostridium perfringens]